MMSVLDGNVIEGNPLVSVSVITYNHGKYIRQCLDGILMQKVNFPYEILIHDDASSDDTADIIREYWEKYPTVIKPILQTENRYSRGLPISKLNYDRAKGKYIAHCEGDDYWTDDGKLQMQIDFLESHSDYIACVHRVNIINEKNQLCNDVEPGFSCVMDGCFNLDIYLTGMRLPGQIASLVMRNIFQSLSENILEEYYSCKSNGDVKLSLLLLLVGKNIWCFEKVMSVYRRVTSEGTSYNARMHGKNLIWIQYTQHNFLKLFAKKNFNIDISGHFSEIYLSSAILSCVLMPSKDNWFVLKMVIKEWGKEFISNPVLHVRGLFSLITSKKYRVQFFKKIRSIHVH